MEKGKVSIVVPVYNSAPYLNACIDSLVAQDYKDLEIILINDGSTDESGEICDQYRENERIRIFHRENHGVSATRNYGIRMAQGEYILFVDSDDTIEMEMVSQMMKNAETTGVECVCCGLWHDYPQRSRRFPEQDIYEETDGVGAIRHILQNYIAIAGPVCKLFHHTLLEENSFPKDLSIGEDAVAVIHALQKAKHVIFDTKPFYHYNHREESLMSSSYSQRDLDLIEAYERIGQELSEKKEIEKEIQFRKIWAHFHVYDKMLVSKNAEKNHQSEVRRWLRSHKRMILSNPFVGKMRKLSFIGLCIHSKLYECIILRRSS